MPQASDELRQTMFFYFGDEIDDGGPAQFLYDQGFVLSRTWEWFKKGATYENLTDKEYHCILFLVHEWDYGGLKEDGRP